MMKCKKIMASFLLIVMLVTPLSAYAAWGINRAKPAWD